MVSDQKLHANRQNAQKSTGPKTAEGKARSSRNALKHGLTAEQVVLPHEDSNAFQELVNDWTGDRAITDPVESALIERSVRNLWKLRRIERSENANMAYRARHAVVNFDSAENCRVAALGRRLTSDPLHRCVTAPLDSRSLKTRDAWLTDDDPVALAQELRSSLSGVEWMLDQWRELDGLLEREGYWHYNDKFRAIRLMGRRPQDVLEAFDIAMLFVTVHAAHPEPWDLGEDIQQACLGIPGKPVYAPRVEYLKGFRYTEPGEPLAELRRIVKEEIVALYKLRDQILAPINDRDRIEAVDRVLIDQSKEGVLLRRYETTCERQLERSLTALLKLRKESAREARDEPQSADFTTCDEPEATSDSADASLAPRPDHRLRNEATPSARSNPSNPQTPPFSSAAKPPNDDR